MEERIFWFLLSEEAAEDMDGGANLLISSKRGGGLLLLPPRPEATRPRAEGGGCSQSLPVSLRLAVRALLGGALRSPGDDGLFSLARSLVRFAMRHSGMPPG